MPLHEVFTQNQTMKTLRLLIGLTAILPLTVFSQDALITNLAKQNLETFAVSGSTFNGAGWNTLLDQVQKTDFVMLGEDHFTNEIPFFASALSDKVHFDNFICETDPYSAKLISGMMGTASDTQLKKYVADFGNVFSFFALEPEFRLMQKLVKANTTVYGTDQIVMNADRLICSALKAKTRNVKAKKIYEAIAAKSKACFDAFLKDPNQPMYMMTDDFDKQVAALLSQKLSSEELQKIADLKLSAKIYKEQNHHLRIQLMKSNLMKVYPQWAGKKNLFKFGAGHLAKGESFLQIYDLGNLVDNLADSQFKKSLHILVLGKSGAQGSPFKGFPEQPIDTKSDDLKALQPLFNAVDGEQWHCLDLLPLRKAMEKKEITIEDILLARVIKGYDFVVIIPKVTAAKFPGE